MAKDISNDVAAIQELNTHRLVFDEHFVTVPP